jgi:hypothetical protein
MGITTEPMAPPLDDADSDALRVEVVRPMCSASR